MCVIVTHVPIVLTSIAAVRLMESVRERLVASWNKAVASAVSTSQHPKQSVTLTSVLAIPVTLAVGKSWRITETAPPPFKGTPEQARLAGLTDEDIAGIAVALKPVLEKKKSSETLAWPFLETWGTARNLQLADEQTRESCAGTVIES